MNIESFSGVGRDATKAFMQVDACWERS